MEFYNLYKKGRHGWFHVTSYESNSLKEAIRHYKKEWCIKIGRNLFNHKVTGL
jgi:hypothetical protein